MCLYGHFYSFDTILGFTGPEFSLQKPNFPQNPLHRVMLCPQNKFSMPKDLNIDTF